VTEKFDSLHLAAAAEAGGADVTQEVQRLLKAGHDPHKTDGNGETAFNVAASNSPVTGRLLTLRWLEDALDGKGSKGLNDRSGSHNSTLAQYIAKWLKDDEIEEALVKAVARGMKPDVPNGSGWTPLTAAAAMGRLRAVQVLTDVYTQEAIFTQTTEEYTAIYDGVPVVYAKGLNALEVAVARLQQDEELSEELAEALWECAEIIGVASKKDRR